MPIRKTEIDKAPYIAYADKPGVIVDGSGGGGDLPAFFPFHVKVNETGGSSVRCGLYCMLYESNAYPIPEAFVTIPSGYSLISSVAANFDGDNYVCTDLTAMILLEDNAVQIDTVEVYDRKTFETIDVTARGYVEIIDGESIFVKVDKTAFPVDEAYYNDEPRYDLVISVTLDLA